MITANRFFYGAFFSFFFFLFSFVPQTQAAVGYPIPQLDDCRNARECQLYCDVPYHSPVCWSYDKYVINKNILGEETVNITYPISDLGNCNSANECFIFCNQPQNQKTCYDFAQARGLIKEKPKLENIITLAKKELGCQNDLECMVFCQQPDNMTACQAFAQKYKLVKEPSDGERNRPSPAILQKAVNGLGCSSEAECMNFCNKPENRNKCFEFAKENNLIKPEEAKEIEKHMEQKNNMVEAARTELGCDSENSCMKICSDPSNLDKCMNLGRKFGMVKEIKEDEKIQELKNFEKKPLPPCTGETECKKYCESHPDECPGFSARANSKASDNTAVKPFSSLKQADSTSSKGDFLGPAGCKSEAECRAYCEKHSSECPGFPKNKVGKNSPPQNPQDGNNHDASRNETSGKNISPALSPR